ncbi:MAG: phospho-N-acetylmuramoyl-pentapeptide-transferase [Clostridiales bacterium]|nr:phospho-N-acetylmuramoyl-pentapeptide-transferase [Clostridiales bacterium]
MLEVLSGAIALVIVLLLMPGFIKYMKDRGMIQPGYDLGPDSFKKKDKPPNMGGLIIALAVFVASLIISLVSGNVNVLLLLMVAAFGGLAIGFADDFIKDVQQHHDGLRPRYKLIGQTVVGLAFSLITMNLQGTAIHLPFTKTTLDLSYAYLPLMTLLYVFMTNSANLQDGVDGLMSSVTLAGSAALGAIALIIKGGSLGNPSIAFACFALTGACLGFLLFNQHPARIYMGDTGSMFIGGLLTGAAMLLRLQIWLLPLCFTMIMSSVSVIVQRLYFKATGGKRLIKMSPIHHHFEMSGWSENKIARRYTLTIIVLSVLAALAALPIAS